MRTASRPAYEHFSNIGLQLFGHTWQAEMAGYLNVDLRRIAHWRTGSLEIPATVWTTLYGIAEKRKSDIERAINTLDENFAHLSHENKGEGLVDHLLSGIHIFSLCLFTKDSNYIHKIEQRLVDIGLKLLRPDDPLDRNRYSNLLAKVDGTIRYKVEQELKRNHVSLFSEHPSKPDSQHYEDSVNIVRLIRLQMRLTNYVDSYQLFVTDGAKEADRKIKQDHSLWNIKEQLPIKP